MTLGWFDAFREDGGPTWYGENRTPVVTDTHTATVAVVFSLFFLAFLLIFPGVRRQRICSFLTVTLCLVTGAVILVCMDHPSWKTGSAEVTAHYRSFSTDRIRARVGLKVGLHWVNVTLSGEPVGQPEKHFQYNERFKFTEVKSMQQELRQALSRGLPYPILTVIEYLSVDKAGFVWGRHFRLAGYYCAALLWFSFALWLLSVVFLCLVPHCYSRMLAGLGGTIVLSSLVYGLSGPKPLRIPFPGDDGSTAFLELTFGWCFYLVLFDGIACLLAGAIVYLLERKKVYTFATFLQVDYDGMTPSAEPPLGAAGPPIWTSGEARGPVVITGPMGAGTSAGQRVAPTPSPAGHRRDFPGVELRPIADNASPRSRASFATAPEHASPSEATVEATNRL